MVLLKAYGTRNHRLTRFPAASRSVLPYNPVFLCYLSNTVKALLSDNRTTVQILAAQYTLPERAPLSHLHRKCQYLVHRAFYTSMILHGTSMQQQQPSLHQQADRLKAWGKEKLMHACMHARVQCRRQDVFDSPRTGSWATAWQAMKQPPPA